MLPIDNFRIVRAVIRRIRHVITQFVQRLHNDAKRFALIVTLQVFDVFEHKYGWPTRIDNAHYIKKKCALRITGETMGPP